MVIVRSITEGLPAILPICIDSSQPISGTFVRPIRGLNGKLNKEKIMKVRKYIFSAAVLLSTVLMAAASAASAQNASDYTFVSANGGLDTNKCTRTSPCRQITRALEYTYSGGTVTILASGDYQPFTIDKNVDIIAEPGINADIAASGIGSNAVHVPYVANGLSAVRLRNLTIKARGAGATAIKVISAVSVFDIVDCDIRGAEVGLMAAGGGDYSIRNTRFSSAVKNIEFRPQSGTVNATVDGCSFNRGWALIVGESARVTIKNSTANGGGFSASGTGARMFVDNCVINASGSDGISVDTGAFVRVSDSTIAYSEGYGIRVNGGSAKTFGNNRLFNNTSGDISGTVGVLSGQ